MAQELTTVIDMDEHFDVDAQMEELARKRYSMPPVVIAAFRQAAMKGANHLLQLVEDGDRFKKLRVQDQLKVLEMIFDRAYGKSETASTHAVAEAKTGATKTSKHSEQLDAIAARAMKAKRLQALDDDGEAPSPASAAIGSVDIFPELKARAKSHGNVVKMPTRPL